MHIYPSHVAIAGLMGGALTFQVPRFQRNYAWTPEETGALLKDLDLCHAARVAGKPRHHFFGGIVTAQSPVQGSTRQNLELIDGQQRLATFLMLAVQLKRATSQLALTVSQNAADSPAAFLRERAKLIQERYESYKDSVNLRVIAVPRLQLSAPDQQFFTSLLQGQAMQSQRRSHELLRSAFDDIGKHLEIIVARAETDLAKARALDVIHEVFEQDWTVIHMAATERSDAYMLFQVLNDRGLSLTEGELLRSVTMEALDPVATTLQMESVEERWNQILRGEASKVRDALRWVYASQVGAYPSGARLLIEFQLQVFPMLQDGKVRRDDSQALMLAIQELQQDISKIELLMAGEWPCVANAPIVQWDRDRLRLLTVHLRCTDCMPLLVAAALLRPEQFSDIVQAVERFLFRYILVEAPRSEISATFNRHAVDIRRSLATYDTRTLMHDLHDLIALHAPDDVFRNRLNDFRYPRSESKKPLKYFLMTLEHYVRWFDEGANGRPVCRDKLRVLDFENGTIEHVYAENSVQPDPQLEPLLDTLGNLTFLSPAENDAAGAKGFAGKKPYLLKSTSALNREIAAEQDWTAAVVRKRQDRLIDIALRVFSI